MVLRLLPRCLDLRQRVFDEMGYHLGIGFADESVVREFPSEDAVVVDDPVVNDRDGTRTIDTWMGVDFGRHPACRPPRVADSTGGRRTRREHEIGNRATFFVDFERVFAGAMPTESYPRYSSRRDPRAMVGKASRLAVVRLRTFVPNEDVGSESRYCYYDGNVLISLISPPVRRRRPVYVVASRPEFPFFSPGSTGDRG